MDTAPHDPGVQDARGGPSGILAAGLALLATAVALFLIWQTSSSLLIIFAGVPFAAFLDAAARALGFLIPVGRTWRLSIVLAALAILFGVAAIWGAGKLPEQSRILFKVMSSQLDVVQQHLLRYGVDILGPEGGRDFAQ